MATVVILHCIDIASCISDVKRHKMYLGVVLCLYICFSNTRTPAIANLLAMQTQHTLEPILHITIDTQSINSNSSCHFFFHYLLLIE